MNLRLLAIVVSVLAVLAAALLFLNRRNGSEAFSKPDRAALLPESVARDLLKIEILPDDGEPITLRRTESGGWILPDQEGLPVDFSRLSRLIQSFLDAEVERLVTENPERIARLGLESVRVRFISDEDEEAALELQLGDTGPSGGRYVRWSNEEAAYLLKAGLRVETTSNRWFAKNPLSGVEPGQIQSFIYERGGGSLVAARKAEGERFTSESIPEGQYLDSESVETFLTSVTGLRLTRPHPQASAEVEEALADPRRLTLNTFDGQRITLSYGRRPEKTLPAEPGETADAGDAEPEPETIPAGPAMLAMRFGEKAESAWVAPAKTLAFEFSGFTYEQLDKELDAFLTDVPPPPPEEEAETESPLN